MQRHSEDDVPPERTANESACGESEGRLEWDFHEKRTKYKTSKSSRIAQKGLATAKQTSPFLRGRGDSSSGGSRC